MINSLQSLRGIFAIFIFLHHISYNGENLWIGGGVSGVCFFFVLSGFVLCAGWEKNIDKKAVSKKDFFLRRLIRLYPLHILCLFVAIMLGIQHISAMGMIKLIPNLLLLQSWIPIESVYFSGNMVSWCLSDFMFLYFLFPFIVQFQYRHPKAFVRCAFGIIIAYLVGIAFIPENLQHALVYINPISRLVDFTIGILLWQAWMSIKANDRFSKFLDSIGKIGINSIEILAVAILVIAFLTYELMPKVYWLDSSWWIPVAIIIIIFTSFNIRGGVCDKLLNSKALVLFGNFSFSFYMIHQLGLRILNAIYSHLFGDINVLYTILPSFIIITFVAYWISRLYEAPVSRWLLNKIGCSGISSK